MDLTSIISGVLHPLLWLLPLIVAGGVLKSPWFKGWLGERKVRTLLREHLDPSVYREFHNLTLRDTLGDTTQIDHVYVSPFGVFVIETKHFGHWIFGRRQDSHWTQQIFRTKVRFQNPIRQNYRHIKVLAALLEVPEDAFRSVVVFTGDAEFKAERPDDVRTCSDLVRYLRSFDAQVLNTEQVGAICLHLQDARLEPTWQTHREHVDNLRRRHGEPARLAPAPSRRADAFAEAAGERLLRAVEDRIRGEGQRRVSRTLQVGLGAVAAKALLGLATMVFIWWVLTTAMGNVSRSLQSPWVVATPRSSTPAPAPAPMVRTPIESEPVAVDSIPQPIQRHPTAAELAEDRRRAEEAARILERSTPEVPLALPGSPVVGPSAYPDRRVQTDGDRAAIEAIPEI